MSYLGLAGPMISSYSSDGFVNTDHFPTHRCTYSHVSFVKGGWGASRHVGRLNSSTVNNC